MLKSFIPFYTNPDILLSWPKQTNRKTKNTARKGSVEPGAGARPSSLSGRYYSLDLMALGRHGSLLPYKGHVTGGQPSATLFSDQSPARPRL